MSPEAQNALDQHIARQDAESLARDLLQPPHRQRVLDEKAQLDERLSKLVTFLAGDVMNTLPMEEQQLLWQQVMCMHMYSNVLKGRIALWT